MELKQLVINLFTGMCGVYYIMPEAYKHALFYAECKCENYLQIFSGIYSVYATRMHTAWLHVSLLRIYYGIAVYV